MIYNVPYDFRIGVLLLVTFIYAIFDVFNKRDVPNEFVYAATAVGIAFALALPAGEMVIGGVEALVIALLGYVVYRVGLLGAGDVFEFVFIVLLLPIQPVPVMVTLQQYGMPFVFSVLIAAGYVASIFIPVYYLLLVRKTDIKRGVIPSAKVAKGVLLFAAYAILLFALSRLVALTAASIGVILLIALASAAIVVFEDWIYIGMVSLVYPKNLEAGDMIAVSLMSKGDVAFFKKRNSGFGRLATGGVIADIKDVKRKLPVYKNSVPFALFLFIGVLASLLIGNILVLVL